MIKISFESKFSRLQDKVRYLEERLERDVRQVEFNAKLHNQRFDSIINNLMKSLNELIKKENDRKGKRK